MLGNLPTDGCRPGRVPRLFGTDITIKQLTNNRYVAVAANVVAPFHQTHTKHSFTIVIESYCYTLIGAN
jgi:hypothetical protein